MKKKNISLFLLVMGAILLGFVVQRYSGILYQTPILTVEKVQKQADQITIAGKLVNHQQEAVTLKTDAHSVAALTISFKEGQQLLLNPTKEEIITEKQDGVVFSIIFIFLGFVLLLGGKSGAMALWGLALNLALLFALLKLAAVWSALPTLGLMLIYGAGSIIITFLANYGIKSFRIDLILTTGAIVLGGFLICLAALKAFENNGIRFEEMQFLTRPYLGVFYGSLLIGGIGAAVDMVVTLVSSLKELVYQQPTITQKELLHSGRRIAQDVTSSMMNVLLLAYLSGAIPMLIFYLKNGWPFVATLQLHLSLELLRAFCGAFTILLSIPASLLCVILERRKQA
ncbi:YibE/F family protein [Enterococcus dispar]|uniref:YibE/F-like protein n=1 Tax=Enterococcus dispar ATCC 51266 TaxID=1139219 RepID=S1P0A0_9ENTE|nr:YibE/F family protein [Enterococcus dispar]EOT40183.1 hypothetical protein OMK_02035 [Enterococcus dispar ATCC 51266]EOW86534.1 hypothetical protein I569_01869 [Enterococcus dispar ATCC 51266]